MKTIQWFPNNFKLVIKLSVSKEHNLGKGLLLGLLNSFPFILKCGSMKTVRPHRGWFPLSYVHENLQNRAGH